MDKQLLDEKRARLYEQLGSCGSLLVALSGGVDSSYLLYAAAKVLGYRAVSATAVSELHPDEETAAAEEFSRSLGIKNIKVETRQMESGEFVKNTRQRCYICKKIMFSRIIQEAEKQGIEHVAHGTNTDDLGDFRPGLKAAAGMGVKAPLADAGLSKQEIRELSRQAGLSVWNRPASGCLATRVPYGYKITRKRLSVIEEAERLLAEHGFPESRVRFHGSIARVEVPAADIGRLMSPETRKPVAEALKQKGFLYTAVDMEGYETGRLNRSSSSFDN